MGQDVELLTIAPISLTVHNRAEELRNTVLMRDET